jgi:hypothetical protein
MSNHWTMRGAAFIGCGLAWLGSTVIDEPPPLWASFMAFGLAAACIFIAARKKEGKS